jgi:hypothetical protein
VRSEDFSHRAARYTWSDAKNVWPIRPLPARRARTCVAITGGCPNLYLDRVVQPTLLQKKPDREVGLKF